MEVLTTTEMERADRLTIAAGTPGFALMMSAGQAVAEAAMDLVGEGSIVVVAGRGNNGGDGFVAAAELAARGREVSVILLCERTACRAMPRWLQRAGNSRCCRSIRRRSASRR
jgi:NAD(P)H-hydrate repair Nnr-like enzyme with NAD(P)H-hydrate epimerase domain